jgi:transcriptional antiterminator RfaH
MSAEFALRTDPARERDAAGAWFVAYTEVNGETRAARHLENQGLQTFLPRYRKLRRHARRIQTVLAPLFPRYVFVRLDLGRDRWRSVNGTRGVQRLVCCGDRPAVVPAGVVEEIAARADAAGVVTLAPSGLRKGDRVRIVEGPLADVTGLFEEMTDARRVTLLLDVLGRPVRVQAPLAFVTAAA